MKKYLFILCLLPQLLLAQYEIPADLNVTGKVESDTLFKFKNGGFIRRNSASTIEISPNGSESFLMNFAANATSGLTMNGVQTILFPGSVWPFRGFTNDTSIYAYIDSTYTWSIKAIKKWIEEHGGEGGGDYSNITLNDSSFRIPTSLISPQYFNFDMRNGYEKHTYRLTSDGKAVVHYASPSSVYYQFYDNGDFATRYYLTDGEFFIQSLNSDRVLLHQDSTGLKLDRGIQLGNSFVSAESDSGTLRYREKTLQVFDGSAWINVGSGENSTYVETIAPLVTCTRDTVATNDSTGYELIVFSGDELDGKNMVDLMCSSMQSDGTAVVTLDAYRLRGSTEVKITSVGASFGTSGIINTSNDDIQAGDKIRFKWTLGSGTAPVGLKAKPIFQ